MRRVFSPNATRPFGGELGGGAIRRFLPMPITRFEANLLGISRASHRLPLHDVALRKGQPRYWGILVGQVAT